MGPIASKLVAGLRRQKASNVIDLAAVREGRAAAGAADVPGLEQMQAGYAAWFRAYAALSRLALPMLGLEELGLLQALLDESEQLYEPGGPDSPVSDSFHGTWALLDAAAGDEPETLAEVAMAMARECGAPAALLDAWGALAESYVGAYVVRRCDGCDAAVEELVTGAALQVQTPAEVLDVPGTLWLTRLLPPHEPGAPWTSLTTPYALAPDMADEWRAYIARATANMSAGNPSEAYRALMKSDLDEPYGWLDYIADAAVGSKGEGVVLDGAPDTVGELPDLPALPVGDSTPIERMRSRAMHIARERGLTDVAVADLLDMREQLMGDAAPADRELLQHEVILMTAHAMYGVRDEHGRTALEMLAEDSSLPAEERAELEAVQAGWFSVFEVAKIKVDEGLELRDIFRRKRLWVTERAATRSVAVGTLIAAWIQVKKNQTFLEGAKCRVPDGFDMDIKELLRDEMTEVRRQLRQTTWRERHDASAPFVTALVTVLHSRQREGAPGHQPGAQELPPEVAAAAASALQGRLETWLDESLPMFDGQSLRELCHSKQGRDDAAELLAEQERSLRTSPVADQIDFGKLWAALGLEYRGPHGPSALKH